MDPDRRGYEAPAEVYDQRFVPALFAPWAGTVAAAAGVARDHAVLDVACGTGALACEVAPITGAEGCIVGLDANPAMLAVARRKPGPVEWIEGRAERLPFEDARFDRVLSQFGLMFFDDPVKALAEMMRVLRPGGRMAVAVCDGVERSPGYATFARLLDRLFGPEIGDAFRRPFALGNRRLLEAMCEAAQIPDAAVESHAGTVVFPSIEELVSTERACAWTLGGLLDDAQFARLAAAAEDELRAFRHADGRVVFAMPALIITARKPDAPVSAPG